MTCRRDMVQRPRYRTVGSTDRGHLDNRMEGRWSDVVRTGGTGRQVRPLTFPSSRNQVLCLSPSFHSVLSCLVLSCPRLSFSLRHARSQALDGSRLRTKRLFNVLIHLLLYFLLSQVSTAAYNPPAGNMAINLLRTRRRVYDG